MSQDVVLKVKYIIFGHGRGWVFTQNDFLSLARDETIRQILSRLNKTKFIRRIAWGIYDYPRQHPKLGLISPDIDQVVKAITRRDNIKVLPTGAYAANLLGLSQQVPAKISYLTEGKSKIVKIGNRELIFKRTTPKVIATADSFAGLVIQALKYIGKENVDELIINKLKKTLTEDDRNSLKKYLKFAPAWIRGILLQIASK